MILLSCTLLQLLKSWYMIFFQLPVLPERWLRGRHDRYVMQNPLWPHDPFVFCPVAHAAIHCYSSQSHMPSCIVHQISHMNCWRSDCLDAHSCCPVDARQLVWPAAAVAAVVSRVDS